MGDLIKPSPLSVCLGGSVGVGVRKVCIPSYRLSVWTFYLSIGRSVSVPVTFGFVMTALWSVTSNTLIAPANGSFSGVYFTSGTYATGLVSVVSTKYPYPHTTSGFAGQPSTDG